MLTQYPAWPENKCGINASVCIKYVFRLNLNNQVSNLNLFGAKTLG